MLVSPVLKPGDGVMDFFAVVAKDDRDGALHYHLFLDTDWQDVLAGDLFIRSLEIQDRRVLMKAVPVDFSEATSGVYHRDLKFTDAAEGLPGVGPVVYISNIPGDNTNFRAIYSSPAGFEPSHLVVTFSGGGCAGDSPSGAQGLGSSVRTSSGPLNKEC